MTTPEEKLTPAPIPGKAPRFLLIAAWFALLTGLGEVALRGVQKFVLHQFTFVSPDIVWMAPLANLFLFTTVGAVLTFAAWLWPKLVSVGVIAFTFSLLGFLGPLLWYPRLHLYAALLLAIGLALQVARLIATHTRGFDTLVRRTTGWMAIVVVGLAVGLWGWRVLTEREALAQLPPAPANAPNVLLIVLDTVRAQNLSMYGYARPTTPQLEQLAKTGIVFERALATAPWTLPSHASMFTGRYPHELSTDWATPLDATYPTLAEVFSAHGYVTAGFVANLLYCTYESGFTRGFTHYEDYPIKLGTIAHSSWLTRIIATKLYKIMGIHQKLVHKTAAELNTDFLRWLSDKEQRPFFVFLNYFDAHAPYAPPPPFDSQFAAKPPRDPWLRDNHRYSPEEIQELMDAYDGAIAYLDHQLGLLFHELAKRDVLNDTLVIITSDHGEEFGEHGLMDHGNSLYLPALHVPLLVAFPSHVPAGQRVREPVSLRNLPATITDLIGLNDKAPFPGSSLTYYWSGTHGHNGAVADPLLSEVNFAPNLPEWFPVSKGNMKSLVADRYHYIRNGDGREELYDIDNDPLEQQDSADDADDRHTLVWLRAFIERILGLHRSPNS